jgi:pimeloyl-ACP methyl ester carboxylesterase
VLEIGYHESGAADAFPVILLHGFPDDAHAYDGVLPLLAEAGYRAFAVYLRGHGATRFLDPAAPRTAEQAAIGQDVMMADRMMSTLIGRSGDAACGVSDGRSPK